MTRGRGPVHEDAHPGHARLRRPGRLLGEHQQPATRTPSPSRPGTFTEQVEPALAGAEPLAAACTPAARCRINQTKFITQNNVAVTNLAITNNGSASTTLQLRATSPYATSGSGNELTGQVNAYNSLTTLFPRLSGDGFTVTSGGLNRSVTVGGRRRP